MKREEPRLREAEADSRDWSAQVGVAFMTENSVGEVFTGNLSPADGEAAGEVYTFTLNWVAHRFEVPWRGRVLKPRFEPYVKFMLVDEAGSSPWPGYTAGVGFRWVDFPWDRWVETSFFTGVGLSYLSQIYRIDRVRHPGEDRSHVKLDWPLQLTFALPRWPRHQLVIFNEHQSGGHIFDEGGVNSLGIGYRMEF